MPRYSYTQFEVDSDDMNVPGSNDPVKPSEGWKGRDANDALRATNSAVRNLGDVAAKLPANADGSPNNGPNNNGRVGTAAFQNTENFQITGGVLGSNVRGSVGPNILVMGVCAVSDIAALYEDQRSRGFDLCDGRLASDPIPPFSRPDRRMPNYMGLFPFFAPLLGDTGSVRFTSGVFPSGGDNTGDYQNLLALTAQRRIAVADHTHGTPVSPGGQGQVGGTTLAYNQLPPVVTNVETQAGSGSQNSGGNRDLLLTFNGNQGSGGSHTHLVGFGGGFDTGNFDIRPPALCVLPFLRVW